jgi:hypothetical protein
MRSIPIKSGTNLNSVSDFSFCAASSKSIGPSLSLPCFSQLHLEVTMILQLFWQEQAHALELSIVI